MKVQVRIYETSGRRIAHREATVNTDVTPEEARELAALTADSLATTIAMRQPRRENPEAEACGS